MSILIGIDGGGTGCRAIVCDSHGTHLGHGKSGPANIMTNFDGARASIIEAAQKAISDAGIAGDEISSANVFLGLAGANVGNYRERMGKALPFARCIIDSDAMISMEGAIGRNDGAVAIIGTGSVFIYRIDGIVRNAGGWGFMVGDLGSGARLGRSLLQETLLAYDGVRDGSELTKYVLAHFKNNPQAIVEYAHSAKPGEFGKFAPVIFDFADNNDPVANKIITDAVNNIEETLKVILTSKEQLFCMLGGLAMRYVGLLDNRYAERVREPLGDAASGAVSLAVRNFSDRGQS
jgi:glucosamine kinase